MPDSIELPYCPHCGSRSFRSGPFKPWHCTSCNFKLYPNVAAAAGVFIFDNKGRILWTERAHEPKIGKLGLPGGFLERGETAETGLLREVEEEVGIQIKDVEYLCSAPNHYSYGGLNYDTLDLFYVAMAVSMDIKTDPTEVAKVHWILPKDIDRKKLAFPSLILALEALRKNA